MKDYNGPTNNKPTWNVQVRKVLRSGRPMSLSRILDELADTMSFDGCQDPLHNLRGVCAKGVKQGWLQRVSRGVFQLTPARAQQQSRESKRRAGIRAAPKPQKPAQKAASREQPRRLQITVGDVILQTPAGMPKEVLAQIVKAIRRAKKAK